MRKANIDDLPQIVDIYNSTIRSRIATAETEKVSIESKIIWFGKRSKARPIFVEEIDDKIAGWLSFEDFYGRPAYHITAEISIYIDECFRGRGIGSKLLSEAVRIGPELGLNALVGYIFSHNTASLKLFEKYGFSKWGELPNIAEMDEKKYSLTIMGREILV